MSKPWKTEVAQEGGNQAFTQMQLDKIKTSGADILIFAGHVRELAARDMRNEAVGWLDLLCERCIETEREARKCLEWYARKGD